MSTEITNEMLWKELDDITALPQTEENTDRFINLLVDGIALGLDTLIYGVVTETDGKEYANPLGSDFDITIFGERNPKANCIFCFTDRKYAQGMDNDSDVQNAVPPVVDPGDESTGQQPYIYINQPSCITAGIEYLLDISLALDYDEDYINDLKENGDDRPLSEMFSDDYAVLDYMIFNPETDRQYVISFKRFAEIFMSRAEECDEEDDE